MASPLKSEKIWFEKHRYDEAEKQFHIKLAKILQSSIYPLLLNGKPLKRAKQNEKKEQVEKRKVDKQQIEKTKMNKEQVEKTRVNKEQDVKVNYTKPKQRQMIGMRCGENKPRIEDKASSNSPHEISLAGEVAKFRQHIKESLECVDGIAQIAAGNSNVDLVNRINTLEKEKADLDAVVSYLQNLVLGLEKRVEVLESVKASTPASKPASKPAPAATIIPPKKAAPPKKEAPKEDDDDGVDLFASDSEEESEEAARIREERLAAYNAKKSKKPELIAKSNIILSVSPWDDETNMAELEKCVRTVEMDGLLWGASKLVPLAYGIHKLHISCVVEDAKVSVDLLQEKIQEFEDYVQSVDIAAFNKV